jgi:hypothetical protein
MSKRLTMSSLVDFVSSELEFQLRKHAHHNDLKQEFAPHAHVQRCGFNFLVTRLVVQRAFDIQYRDVLVGMNAYHYLNISLAEWKAVRCAARGVWHAACRHFNLDEGVDDSIRGRMSSGVASEIQVETSLFAALGGSYPIACFVDQAVDSFLSAQNFGAVMVKSEARTSNLLKYALTELASSVAGGSSLCKVVFEKVGPLLSPSHLPQLLGAAKSAGSYFDSRSASNGLIERLCKSSQLLMGDSVAHFSCSTPPTITTNTDASKAITSARRECKIVRAECCLKIATAERKVACDPNVHRTLGGNLRQASVETKREPEVNADQEKVNHDFLQAYDTGKLNRTPTELKRTDELKAPREIVKMARATSLHDGRLKEAVADAEHTEEMDIHREAMKDALTLAWGLPETTDLRSDVIASSSLTSECSHHGTRHVADAGRDKEPGASQCGQNGKSSVAHNLGSMEFIKTEARPISSTRAVRQGDRFTSKASKKHSASKPSALIPETLDHTSDARPVLLPGMQTSNRLAKCGVETFSINDSDDDSTVSHAARESSLARSYDMLDVELHCLDDDINVETLGRKAYRATSFVKLPPVRPPHRMASPSLQTSSAMSLDLGSSPSRPRGHATRLRNQCDLQELQPSTMSPDLCPGLRSAAPGAARLGFGNDNNGFIDFPRISGDKAAPSKCSLPPLSASKGRGMSISELPGLKMRGTRPVAFVEEPWRFNGMRTSIVR